MAEEIQSDLNKEPAVTPEVGATDALLDSRYRGAFAEQEAKQKPLIEEMALAEREKARIEREGVESGQGKMKEGFATYQEQIKEPQEFIRKGFEPTRENAKDLTALFATTAIAAFMGGGGGRYSGMAALNNMAGAMEGYRKGRKDLFERELKEFDKNFKAAQTALQTASDELKSVVEIAKLDPILAQAKSKEYAAKYAGTKLAYDFNKGSFDQKIKTATEIDKAAMKMQEALAKIEGAERKLSGPERKELRGFENLNYAIDELRRTFKPEYANMKADVAGQAKAIFEERIRNNPEMAEWWRRYENVALPERHAMFGATLTGGERESWRRASIGPGNSTAAIEGWLNDKTSTLNRKIGLLKGTEPTGEARQQPAADRNIQTEATTRFGAYEPDKYNYGFENGRFYRERK